MQVKVFNSIPMDTLNNNITTRSCSGGVSHSAASGKGRRGRGGAATVGGSGRVGGDNGGEAAL